LIESQSGLASAPLLPRPMIPPIAHQGKPLGVGLYAHTVFVSRDYGEGLKRKPE